VQLPFDCNPATRIRAGAFSFLQGFRASFREYLTTTIMKYAIGFFVSFGALFSIPALAQSPDQVNSRVESALNAFHNDFLPGVDYKQAIRFPASTELVQARLNFIIAVGQDIALIFTAGQSELVVKKIQLAVNAVDYVAGGAEIIFSDNPLETAMEIALFDIADSEYRNNTVMKSSIPGLRSMVTVYALAQAGDQEQARIDQAVADQVELLELAGKVAPAVAGLVDLIGQVQSAQRVDEYLLALRKMIQRKSELNVYRQMQYERNRSAIEGIEGLILQEIDFNMAAAVAEGSQTPVAHRQVQPVAVAYAMGFAGREALNSAIRNFIGQNRPFNAPSGFDERVFNSVQAKLGPLDRARRDINAYGGAPMSHHTRVDSFPDLAGKMGIALKSRIPPTTMTARILLPHPLP
jgi:hypothetical protein